MLKIKGFIKFNNLVTNAIGVVSPIGEISSYSNTFAKEWGEYTDVSIPSLCLITSKSVDANGIAQVVSTVNATHVLTVAKWLYDYSVAQPNAYTTIDVLNALNNHYGNTLTGFACGDIITNGDIWIPQWISWNNVSLGNLQVKIWFSDHAFQQQYDEYEIVVIPPIANLNSFFGIPSTVKALVNSRTQRQVSDSIALAKNKNPETVLRAEDYNCNPVGYTSISTTWWVIINGQAGDNPDSIKEAIINFALANSTHNRAEWESLFPDLFKRTEFVILPRWDSYAIPNMSIQAGTYSPVVNPVECVAFAKLKVPSYPALHIDQYIRIMSNPYKSLPLITIGSPDNRDNKFSISDYFPDYIAQSTSSTDFNRMSQVTQDWSILLQEMLIVAEEMTLYSDIPLNMRRVVRNNITYVSKYFNNVQYLVAARFNYPATA